MTETTELRVKIVRKLVRSDAVGSHKKQVDTVKNWFRSSDQGQVEELIRELIRDPEAPLEGYGGTRDNVRLTSVEAAAEFIEQNGGDLPWGLREE